jgi:hypothetical protein
MITIDLWGNKSEQDVLLYSNFTSLSFYQLTILHNFVINSSLDIMDN